MVEFFFAFFSGYSSTPFYAPSYHFLYEAFFTGVYGVLLFGLYSDVGHSRHISSA